MANFRGPLLALGLICRQFGERLSLELSWVHLSHAKLAGQQNPGIDLLGLRLNYQLR